MTESSARSTVAPTSVATSVAQLLHTEQQRTFMLQTGLGRRGGVVPTPEEVAADWYDLAYLACLRAVQQAGLPALYASWRPTDADFVLWVYKLRRDLRAHDATVDFDAAATHARQITEHERSRREFRRGGGRPLPRRDS